MVGLVIVSHSHTLAQGVAELARGMAGEDVRLAAVGGLDMPNRPLGTDPNLVRQAIEAVDSPDGVLVLMDLGSAVLSAEMALEMLPADMRDRIRLCEAPLIEGAISAAVQARLGVSLEQVAAEARGALASKAAQLGAAPPPAPLPDRPASAQPAETIELRLVVGNRLGLHARPAARFVQTAAGFQSKVEVENLSAGRGPVSAKSINAVATLGVRQAHEIRIAASGPDAQDAVAALQALAGQNFGDEDEGAATIPEKQETIAVPAVPPADAPRSALQGLPASPGIAIGAARLFVRSIPDIPTSTVADPQTEWAALLAALDKTRSQIEITRSAVGGRAGPYAAAIFDAHALFLDDEALREPARRAIFDDHLNAAAAWLRATDSVAAAYRALDDEYQRARAQDISDVGQQVIRNLLGAAASAPVMPDSGVLIAPDLAPADTAHLDPALVLGICTAFGGPTSHSAILARSFGIPAVVGLGQAILGLREGALLVVDGASGLVIPDPDETTLAEYRRRAEAMQAAQSEARAASAGPAVTRGGRRIEIAANIGSPEESRAAVAAGADGVGLFRTEFLFLDRRTAPTEEEQVEAYRAAAEALNGRPLIIRTLDVGGDKPLPYVDLGAEANPFLGWRAIRLCLERPELFKTQLRAILRVAAGHPVKVMFPMIATLEEFRSARRLLAEAREEIQQRGHGAAPRIETGIMVEIPSAALRAAQFAPEVDFFSIGTNDLSQYTLAAERGNAKVAALADPFHPAVLQLIRAVVDAAHAKGKWVGVCGELAGDPLAVPLLVGLGVDELSMNGPAIPRAKQIVRALDDREARALAAEALELENAAAVRARAQAALDATG